MAERTYYRSGYLLLVAFVVVLSSCQREELEPVVKHEQEISPESEGLVKTVLGKKLENPYSVANMKRAVEELEAAGPDGTNGK